MNQLKNRSRGALVGLAIGDALGTTNEFKEQDEVTHITDIVGGGPFGLEVGQWTDDTAMALCLGQSLIEKGFDMKDQLNRYNLWLDEGYMSCTGVCFDIGSATYNAINAYKKTGDSISGSTHPRSSGNGNIMRLAPVVLKYHDDREIAITAAEVQSITTHATSLCKESAALMAEIMHRCINRHYENLPDLLEPSKHRSFYNKEVSAINKGDYKQKTFEEVWTHGGFVAATLEFALWCFYNTHNFKDCVLLAANAGGDADTNAAVAGQLAGAFYGFDAIPTEWVKKLVWNDVIIAQADRLILK